MINGIVKIHFDNKQDIHTNSKSYEEIDCGRNLDLLILLPLISCFQLHEKWVQSN